MSMYTSTYAEHVKELVELHRGSTRNGKLLFAGWYDRSNEKGDVKLLEVYEEFPDPGIGKLETFLFPSSSKFPIKGSLTLTVTSPSELQEAATRNDPTLAGILASSDKEVIYPEGGNWNDVIQGLIR